MMKITLNLFFDILFALKNNFDIVLENLALRQQLAAMKRSVKRPQLRTGDGCVAKNLSGSRRALIGSVFMRRPQTILRQIESDF